MQLPQLGFDDLYTRVYALIDDAKRRHDLVKMYKGSHAAPNPAAVALDYGRFFTDRRRGLLGFACARTRPAGSRYRPEHLDEFDRRHAPRVPTRRAFELLSCASRHPAESPADYLSYVANRRHRLGAYRGGSSGFEDESRAFAAA